VTSLARLVRPVLLASLVTRLLVPQAFPVLLEAKEPREPLDRAVFLDSRASLGPQVSRAPLEPQERPEPRGSAFKDLQVPRDRSGLKEPWACRVSPVRWGSWVPPGLLVTSVFPDLPGSLDRPVPPAWRVPRDREAPPVPKGLPGLRASRVPQVYRVSREPSGLKATPVCRGPQGLRVSLASKGLREQPVFLASRGLLGVRVRWALLGLRDLRGLLDQRVPRERPVPLVQPVDPQVLLDPKGLPDLPVPEERPVFKVHKVLLVLKELQVQ